MDLNIDITILPDDYLPKVKQWEPVSILIHQYFKDRNYGDSVKELSIGIALYNEDMEKAFPEGKQSKPKYTAKKTLKIAGMTYEIEKKLEYTIRINSEKIAIAFSTDSFLHLIAEEVMHSLYKLDQVKMIKDFDRIKFKEKLYLFFKGQKILR